MSILSEKLVEIDRVTDQIWKKECLELEKVKHNSDLELKKKEADLVKKNMTPQVQELDALVVAERSFKSSRLGQLRVMGSGGDSDAASALIQKWFETKTALS